MSNRPEKERPVSGEEMTGGSTQAIPIGGSRNARSDSDHIDDMSMLDESKSSADIAGASFVRVTNDGSPSTGLVVATVHETGYRFGIMESVSEESSEFQDCVMLPGEKRLIIGTLYKVPIAQGGYVSVTTYRVIIVITCEEKRRIGIIPLPEIEQVDLNGTLVKLTMKGGRITEIVFSNDSDTQKFHKVIQCIFYRLNKTIQSLYGAPHKSSGDVVPLIPDDFEIFAWAFSKAVDAKLPEWLKRADSIANEITHIDFNRLEMAEDFKISSVNENFEVCPTYPEKVIVPKGISDDDIRKGAPYRSIGRFPAVVWRCRKTKAVLLRSSQPQVGILSWRNPMDEKIIEEAVKAGTKDIEDKKQFIIMDARGYTSAFANRARSGGFENTEYYQQAKLEFLGLPNIHAVRASFANIRNMIHEPGEPQVLLTTLQSTMWLNNISNLLSNAFGCAEYLMKGHSVLVHCSDGWDRTTQVTTLAKLMIDEHYRTIEGFEQLVRRDWIAFGHKLHDRQLISMAWGDHGERSPIFLQFLEAVRYLQTQQPTAFEFTHSYLLKLAKHTYSGLFGTFLFNSHKERKEVMEKKGATLVEIWRYIGAHDEECVNQNYDADLVGPLKPMSMTVIDLHVWRDALTDEGEQFKLINREDPRPSSGINTPMASSTTTMIKSKSSESLNSLNADPSTPGSINNTVSTGGENFMSTSVTQQIVATFDYFRTSVIDNDGLVHYNDEEQANMRKNMKKKQEEHEREMQKMMCRKRTTSESTQKRRISVGDVESVSGLERTTSDMSLIEPHNELPNFRPPTTWETKATQCKRCERPFNDRSVYVEDRQHHCRNCGSVVCDSCSKHRFHDVEEGMGVQKRVCTMCYESMHDQKLIRIEPKQPESPTTDKDYSLLEDASIFENRGGKSYFFDDEKALQMFYASKRVREARTETENQNQNPNPDVEIKKKREEREEKQ